jgi:hypothetical protein
LIAKDEIDFETYSLFGRNQGGDYEKSNEGGFFFSKNYYPV